MADKNLSKSVLGKTIVSKGGRKFGEVADLVFETRSGELIHVVIKNPTEYANKLDLERDSKGNLLLPFSAVEATGDYLLISEGDLA